jgi:hypothetical protein
MPNAKLGAKVDRYSFLVRILHSLLHTGLARRTNIPITLTTRSMSANACLRQLSVGIWCRSMSVSIVFPNGTEWFKANWVFRQIVEDVSARYQNDEGIRTALELAQALGSLDLKQMDGHLRHKVMQAIRTIGNGQRHN